MKILRQEPSETTKDFEKRVNKATGEAHGCHKPTKATIQVDPKGKLIAVVED